MPLSFSKYSFATMDIYPRFPCICKNIIFKFSLSVSRKSWSPISWKDMGYKRRSNASRCSPWSKISILTVVLALGKARSYSEPNLDCQGRVAGRDEWDVLPKILHQMDKQDNQNGCLLMRQSLKYPDLVILALSISDFFFYCSLLVFTIFRWTASWKISADSQPRIGTKVLSKLCLLNYP